MKVQIHIRLPRGTDERPEVRYERLADILEEIAHQIVEGERPDIKVLRDDDYNTVGVIIIDQ